MISRISDRTGHGWVELTWHGDHLRQLRAADLIVDGEVIDDPLLGRAHRVVSVGVTAMTSLDWARPGEIPTIAAPRSLAPGTGGLLLNTIALLAQHAGVAALRYAGPYPTPALWRTIARSFTTTAAEPEFTHDLFDRIARVARDPIPIAFVPAPFERHHVEGGYVELRSYLERATIHGVSYEPHGSPARLVDGRCEVWFGDAPYAHVATLAPDGSLVEGPRVVPTCTSDVIGKAFPPALSGALAELVADAVPPPLASDASTWIASRPLVWADLGARAARATRDGFEVHAALWQRIAPLGLDRLALALTEALAPVVIAALVDNISQAR